MPELLYANINTNHVFAIGVNRHPQKGNIPIFSILNGGPCGSYFADIFKRGIHKKHGKRPFNFIDKRTGIDGMIQYLEKSKTPHIHNNRYHILKSIMDKGLNKNELSEVLDIVETNSNLLTEDEVFHVEEYLLKSL